MVIKVWFVLVADTQFSASRHQQ